MVAFSCERCTYATDKKSSFINHMHRAKPCATIFSETSREDILQALANKKPCQISCQFCSKTFSGIRYLRLHEPHCHVCNKTSQLRTNIEIQAQEIQDLQETIDEQALKIQELTTNKNTKRKLFSNESLDELSRNLSNTSIPCKCSCCDRTFASQQYLDIHMKSRTPSTPSTSTTSTSTSQLQEIHATLDRQTLEILKNQQELQAIIDEQAREIQELRQKNASPPSDPEIQPSTSRPSKGRKKLNKALRMTVWNTAFGKDNATGKCFCCNIDVTQQDFEAGHMRSVANGGIDHITNLKVVCRLCNGSMGKEDMIKFKERNF